MVGAIPAVVRTGNFFGGLLLITMLLARGGYVYASRFTADAMWYTPLAGRALVLSLVFSIALIGILFIYGSDVTLTSTERFFANPVLAVVFGGLFFIGLALAAIGFYVGFEYLVGVVNSVTITPILLVLMAMLIFAIALASAVGLYIALILSVAALIGYVLVAKLLVGRFGPLVTVLVAGVLAGGIHAIPYLGLIVEVGMMVLVAGTFLIGVQQGMREVLDLEDSASHGSRLETV